MAATFYQTVSAAIADFVANGYDGEDRLKFWSEALRSSAVASMMQEPALEARLQRVLRGNYDRLVERGGLLRRHPSVSSFTLTWAKPRLRAELDRRLLAAAGLIRLNRQQVLADMERKFQGWAVSVPAGGSRAVDRSEVKAAIRKELASLPFRERRVLIDQSHKMTAALSDIMSVAGGAIAGRWHSNWRQPNYEYREDHKERDEIVYLVRNSWAHRARLVRPGKAGYSDQVTQPGQEIFCRCWWRFLYELSDLPDDMLTERGRQAMTVVRQRMPVA